MNIFCFSKVEAKFFHASLQCLIPFQVKCSTSTPPENVKTSSRGGMMEL